MIDLRKVAEKLRRQSCPEHQEHPSINLTKEGMDIKACCEKFRDILLSRYKELESKAFDDLFGG